MIAAMDLQRAQRVYDDVVAALRQTHSAAMVAAAVLSNFPRDLPERIKKPFDAALTQLSDTIHEQQKQIADDRKEAEDPAEIDRRLYSAEIQLPEDPVVASLLFLALTTASTIPPQPFDFGRVLFEQDLVSTCAHLDGFLTDMVKLICEREPRILLRRKHVASSTILEAGSWERLIGAMIDEYAFELGWKTISDRIKHMSSDIGLELNEDTTRHVEVLEQAYQYRHLIVHSGGRVTREFLARTTRTDATLGQRIRIGWKYAEAIHGSALSLCGDIFVAVAGKFFDASDADLVTVWRGDPRRPQLVFRPK